MRVTIIPADGFVSVDGLGFNGIDMTSIESTVHAVQWYGTEGDIERKDQNGKIFANEPIDSIDQFSVVLAMHSVLAAEYLAHQAAAAEEQNIIEV